MQLPTVLDISGRCVHLEDRRPAITRGGPRGKTVCGIEFVCRVGQWTRDRSVILAAVDRATLANPITSCPKCLVVEGARNILAGV